MTRLLNNLILALALLGIDASEPHLRNSNRENLAIEEDVVGDRSRTMSIEKGMKCSGKFERHHSDTQELADGMRGRRCEGGMKAEFEGKATPADMANEVAQVLTDQMKEAMDMHNPSLNHGSTIEDLLYPSKEDMETLMMELDDLEDGEKTMQFGGVFEAKWGCNVTVATTGERGDGTLSKTVSCGFSKGGGRGRRSAAADFFEAVE